MRRMVFCIWLFVLVCSGCSTTGRSVLQGTEVISVYRDGVELGIPTGELVYEDELINVYISMTKPASTILTGGMWRQLIKFRDLYPDSARYTEERPKANPTYAVLSGTILNFCIRSADTKSADITTLILGGQRTLVSSYVDPESTGFIPNTLKVTPIHRSCYSYDGYIMVPDAPRTKALGKLLWEKKGKRRFDEYMQLQGTAMSTVYFEILKDGKIHEYSMIVRLKAIGDSEAESGY